MTEAETFRARADQAASAAAETDLDNVRERHLRSQAAWAAMADRSERVATARAKNESEKRAAHEALV